ncbi:MAG: SAM-dependent methyltransferase [Betaproteobacteria bacterium]|nr:SAM-dependent methyltransferase [Betaproteobacteria bacterium]
MQALLDAMARATPGPDAGRIFHGRGALHPGCEHLALDWYAPVWLLTSFQTLSDAQLASVHAALAQRPGPLNWVYQCRTQGGSETRLMAGSVPDPHVVSEQGARYRVHLLKGQNHGLFLDMAAGRQWLREQAQGLRVLNLFAYTCAFSVAALQGGAAEVVNLDMAAGALSIGQHNHQLNGLSGARFLAHDLFKSWGKVKRMGPYDVVVADPPSHQKGSFVASKDYARVVRRLPELLVPEGLALLCLNAPEMPSAYLRDLVAAEAPALRFVRRLDNPAAFADAQDERALKVLLFQHGPSAG